MHHYFHDEEWRVGGRAFEAVVALRLPWGVSAGLCENVLPFPDNQCSSCFLFLFLLRQWQGGFFFILPSWPDNRRLLSGKLLWAVCSWCGPGSPGEQGDASSVSSPEEYSGVVKLVWCRSWRYFSLVLLKKIPYPSATEFLHSVVTTDHPQSFCQGTKWFICNAVFNWQVELLLWFSLCFWASITFFFEVELGFSTYLLLSYWGFKWQEGARWLKKPLEFHWRSSPAKITVYKTIYRLKSLFHLVPVPFWEWPQQQVPPEASFAECSDSDEPVHCRGTSLCIPHLLEIISCHESLFSFVLFIISDPLFFNSSSKISIMQGIDCEDASKKQMLTE